ncbi:MAG: hypothetical protein LAO51_00030 [Acidobacteriia bacterium]|nr:hypothetical protein [Terriglobia bacterium]
MTRRCRGAIVLMASLLVILASVASASDPAAGSPSEKKKDCDMTYSLKGWSAIYKTAKGEGSITCTNGQTAQVAITVHGGGLTFGKTEIFNGKAEISGVRSINEIYGSYASMAAHAGVAKAGAVEVMTKGKVSLALAGTGEGVDIGIDFSKFTISKIGTAESKHK